MHARQQRGCCLLLSASMGRPASPQCPTEEEPKEQCSIGPHRVPRSAVPRHRSIMKVWNVWRFDVSVYVLKALYLLGYLLGPVVNIVSIFLSSSDSDFVFMRFHCVSGVILECSELLLHYLDNIIVVFYGNYISQVVISSSLPCINIIVSIIGRKLAPCVLSILIKDLFRPSQIKVQRKPRALKCILIVQFAVTYF